MSKQYQEAGYGDKEVGFGNRSAILVVDFQLAFTDPAYPTGNMPMVHSAHENTVKLLKVAREKQVPVAKTYTSYESEKDLPYWKVAPMYEYFFKGDPATQIDPRVHDGAYDFTFSKSAPSIFFNTPLLPFLIKHQVDTTIITGCTTSGCIRASIIDAFSNGFRIIVPEECCGDASEAAHVASLDDCNRRYADVIDLGSVITYLNNLKVS